MVNKPLINPYLFRGVRGPGRGWLKKNDSLGPSKNHVQDFMYHRAEESSKKLNPVESSPPFFRKEKTRVVSDFVAISRCCSRFCAIFDRNNMRQYEFNMMYTRCRFRSPSLFDL